MVRAPYPARIAAGLVVTAVEETRKLPTLLFTLPVTAVSETLQLAMRAQQASPSWPSRATPHWNDLRPPQRRTRVGAVRRG